jgi:hypothetical protein
VTCDAAVAIKGRNSGSLTGLRGSLEVFDLRIQLVSGFHLGKIWATISKLLILND